MDILSTVLNFFKSKDFSPASKIIGCIIAVSLIFLIDNQLGFSFSYRNGRMISALTEIENLKQKSQSDSNLIQYLNEKETRIINRRTLFEQVINLFSNSDLKVDDILQKGVATGASGIMIQSIDSFSIPKLKPTISTTHKVVIKPVIAKRSRSQIWHTLSSSYLFLLLILLFIIVPFVQKDNKKNTLLGCILIIPILLLIVWFNQYLFGLIPVIQNQPLINYSLNFLIHTTSVVVFVGLIGYFVNKKNK